MLAILAAILVTGDPVSVVLPAADGPGLCAATSVSTSPATDFPQSTSTFVSGVNAFMEANTANRTTAIADRQIDFTNGQGTASGGDFTTDNAFSITDPTTAYATRLRGYLAVDIAGTLHLGAYADDAVAIVIYDAAGTAYPVIVRPPALGTPAWRSTNSVTFAKAGVYPIEILHVQIANGAALEASASRSGSFTDFELPANNPSSTNLATAGFALLGGKLYLDPQGIVVAPATCAQCDRAAAGTVGTGTCGTGMFCGRSAVCEPCATAEACGPSCEVCSDPSSVCQQVTATEFQCFHFADDFPPPLDFDAKPGNPDAGSNAMTGGGGGGGCCSTGTGPAGLVVPLAMLALLRRRRLTRT